jgi:hypothetical protein
MRSSSREEVVDVFDALQADVKRALDLSFDALTIPERLGLLQLCEKVRRQLPAIEHPLINQISGQADQGPLPLEGTQRRNHRRQSGLRDKGQRPQRH